MMSRSAGDVRQKSAGSGLRAERGRQKWALKVAAQLRPLRLRLRLRLRRAGAGFS